MKMKRLMMLVCVAALTACVFCVPTYAASGDVAGAIEGTWDTASEQIKTVVNNVVFPAPTAPTIAIRFMVALN